jgi:ectoine hydroxylase-related dioxygenase (phytanoyl-CoA dioxygenase family)
VDAVRVAGQDLMHAHGNRRWVRLRELPDQLVAAFDDALLASPVVPWLEDYFRGAVAVLDDHSKLRRSAPGDADTMIGFHQDVPLFGIDHAATVWISLTEAGETAPGLAVLPGSHRRTMPHVREYYRPAGHSPAHHETIVIARDEQGLAAALDHAWIPAFAPGDAMIFTARTIHATHTETSMRRGRLSVEIRFVPEAIATPEHVRAGLRRLDAG